LLAVAAIAAAADKPRGSEAKTFRLQWQDLDRLAHGHRADLVLPNGAVLGGKVLAVESDALVLDLKKTSDKKAWPKGCASIPRAQVSHLRITKVKSTWRTTGAAIGLAVGAIATISLVLFNQSSEARLALAAAPTLIVPAAAGYGLGWGADHKKTEIDIEPGTPSR
jgi:hypothetical protein